jgi:hypothetical protein
MMISTWQPFVISMAFRNSLRLKSSSMAGIARYAGLGLLIILSVGGEPLGKDYSKSG